MVSVQIKILTVPTSYTVVLQLQVYVSQEAETLAVHSLLTIQNIDAIKRNVQKWWVFAQRVTTIKLVLG